MKHLFKSTLILLATFLPTIASAYDFEVNGIYYNVNGNQATVTYKTTNYNSYNGSVAIPETVNYSGTEYQVTAIGNHAFHNSEDLTIINIPNTITSIGDYAFRNCDGLTRLAVPNSVISIGNYAFKDCSFLTYLSLGNSLTAIGQYAFADCSELVKVTIPNSVQTIDKYAFNNCDSLRSVEIGNSVKTIGNWAFGSCNKLNTLYFNAVNCSDFNQDNFIFCHSPIAKIIIGDEVTKIPAYFVYGYSDYSSANYRMTSLVNLKIGNSVASIGQYAFAHCSGLTNVNIPNTIISIAKYAFYNCSGMTNLTLGNSVTSIGDFSFFSCSKLTNVIIPNSVSTIGQFAFAYCSDLTSLTLGNSVSTIGNNAFSICSKLSSLTIGNSVTSIGSSAFGSCNNLNTIYITGEGEWNAGVLPCNSQIATLCIGNGITGVRGMKVNPLNIYCYATTPPTCDNNSFTAYRGSLHVPATSLSSYFVAPIWENFSYILGDAIEVQSVKLSEYSLNMLLGDEEELTASVKPTGARPDTIIWTSSNSSIATINDGLVTAVGVGECDIIASYFDKRAVCHVIVRDTIAVILDEHEAQLLPNHILLLNPTVIPVTTGITVTSSDPTVAAARVVNNQVQVVGVREGTTIITVGSSNGTAQVDTCLVTVYTEPGDVNMDGFVNISDVTQMIDYLLGSEVSIFKEANADLNGDDSVTIGDVTALIDLLLSSGN